MQPRASVVIVAYGQAELARRAVASIERELGPRLGTEFELVLVDNASPDGAADVLAGFRDRATVLMLPQNRNFAGGYNAGARAAQGNVLVLLNSDTEVTPGALDRLVETAEDPSVGLAGARLLYPDGTIQHGGWGFVSAGAMPGFHYFQHEPGDLAAAAAVYDLDGVTGACHALRRSVFLDAGGYDERYANGWEDVDLCHRLRADGLRVVYRGDAVVVHHEGATRGPGGPADDGNAALYRSLHGFPTEGAAARVDRLFGADLASVVSEPAPPAVADGAPIVLAAPFRSLDPHGAEAMTLLELLGADTAARNRRGLPAAIVPKLPAATRDLLARAERRAAALDAVEIVVGGTGDGGVARVTALPDRPLRFRALWVHTEELARELRALGLRAEWLPTPLPPLPPSTAGGRGVLAVLPAHDPAACRSLLAALAGLQPAAVCLAPTVASEFLLQAARDALPHAEIAPAVSTAAAFAQLAADFDVAVCPADGDPYGRRALVAAALGAVVLTAPEQTAVVRGLAATAAERAARAGRVRAVHAPHRVAARLAALLGEAALAA